MSYQHFELICGRPETSRSVELFDEQNSLMSVLQDVFQADTNLCVMQWNGVFVPLSYKYDVSWILADAIGMVEALRSRPPRERIDVLFPSNDFRVDWHITGAGERITVDAEWGNVVGGLTELLEDRSPLLISRDRFISEWRHLFAVVVRAVQESGADESRLDDYDRLLQLARFRSAAGGNRP